MTTSIIIIILASIILFLFAFINYLCQSIALDHKDHQSRIEALIKKDKKIAELESQLCNVREKLNKQLWKEAIDCLESKLIDQVNSRLEKMNQTPYGTIENVSKEIYGE